MSLEIDIDETTERVIKFPNGYEAKAQYNLWLTRDLSKDGSTVDSDGSWIELTIGREWGEHATIVASDLSEIKKLLLELNGFICDVERLRWEAIKGLPKDFKPTQAHWIV